jgi:hypothetical protein
VGRGLEQVEAGLEQVEVGLEQVEVGLEGAGVQTVAWRLEQGTMASGSRLDDVTRQRDGMSDVGDSMNRSADLI